MTSLQVVLAAHKGQKSFLEVLNGKLLAIPGFLDTTNGLWWDNDAAGDVNNTILGDDVLEGDGVEGVDLDGDKAAEAADVDGQSTVLKKSREVDMEVTGLLVVNLGGVSLVVGIGVEGVAGHDVVLEESLQVLGATLREQESVDVRAKLLECPVVRCENCAAVAAW